MLAFRARAVGTATAGAATVGTDTAGANTAGTDTAGTEIAAAVPLTAAIAATDTSCLFTRFCVRLDDMAGERRGVWFTQCFDASDGWQDFQIDLRSLRSNVGDRGLNLQKLLSVVIFFPKPSASTSLAVDDLRLR